MMKIIYAPKFVRAFGKLEESLKEEVLEKIELLKNNKNHQKLKVHKLHGRMKDYSSFSVNYKWRIVFQFESKNEIQLLAVGDHVVYQ